MDISYILIIGIILLLLLAYFSGNYNVNKPRVKFALPLINAQEESVKQQNIPLTSPLYQKNVTNNIIHAEDTNNESIVGQSKQVHKYASYHEAFEPLTNSNSGANEFYNNNNYINETFSNQEDITPESVQSNENVII